jgi:hypothetical protein
MSDLCPYQDTETAGRYLASRLTESERERFEEHYFGCDACFAEVSTGAEIRAAIAARPPARTRPWRFRFAAAAAVVAALAAVPFFLERSRPGGEEQPVWRSSATAPHPLHLTAENDQWTFRWDAHPEAVEYEIELLSEEGNLLLRQATAETSMVIDRSAIPPATATKPVYARLRALDASGAPTRISDLKRIEPHALPR